MSYDNIEKINTIYDKINNKNDNEYENRLEDLYKKYPDIATTRKNIISLKVQIAKSNILNEIDKATEYQKELDLAVSNYTQLLKVNNLKESDFEKHYDCADCKDTGFIDGKKCHCYIDKEIEVYKKLSNFDNYKNILDNFNLNVYKQNIMSVENSSYFEYMVSKLSTIKEMILEHNKLNKPINIYISGKTGTGKTFLSRFIGQSLLNNHKTVIHITANDLMNAVFSNISNDKTKESILLDYIDDCDVLILDDLGKENVNDFSIRYIYNLIDTRLNNKQSTIVCTQHNLSEISEIYEEGLTPRLYNYFFPIRLAGKDLRGIG